MKKLTALVLALLMALSLGSVALADTVTYTYNGYTLSAAQITDADEGIWGNITLDGAHIDIDLGAGFVFEEETEDGVYGTVVIAPGSKFYVDVIGLLEDLFGKEYVTQLEDVEALLKNFKCEYKVTKGAALVKDISYKNGKITFELKENYTISEIKDLEFTVTLTAKKNLTTDLIGYSDGAPEENPDNSTNGMVIPKGTTIKLVVADNGIGVAIDGQFISKNSPATLSLAPENVLIPVRLGVANAVVTLEGAEEADDADIKDITGWPRNNIIYKVEEDEAGYVKFGGTTSLFQITANMNSKEKLFLHLIEDDKDIIDALTKNNTDATLHTYTLEGKVAFRNAAEFTVQADYADQYTIYAYNDGKLTKVDVEWDSIEGVYKWNATEMTTYVISDVELVAADETAAEAKNPDTGANDVIGVAAALAVVSLAAAAALSRKK